MQATVITNYGRPLETQDRPDPTPTNPVPVSELCLTINRTSTKTIVHCRGRITLETAQSLTATVKPLFSDGITVVLDLINASYIDSSGLGSIARSWVTVIRSSHSLTFVDVAVELRKRRCGKVARLSHPPFPHADTPDLAIPQGAAVIRRLRT